MKNKIIISYIPYFLVASSYIFGIICIQLSYWLWLVNLSWFQMLLSSILIIYTFPDQNPKPILWYVLVSGLTGFFIEVLGVNTGAIFGVYQYGQVLGWKIWGTPLVIGLNWFLVTYCVNQVVSLAKLKPLLHAIIAAIVITAFDYLIEPDAIRLEMWTWEGGEIPLKNYAAWWIVSFWLSYYYTLLKLPRHTFSYLLLFLMVIFFMIK